MKGVVFISSILPFPLDAAKKVTVSGILRYLCERYGAERVTYILLSGVEGGESLGKEMPCKLLTLKKPGARTQVWNTLWFVLIRRAKSIQESVLYSAKLQRELLATIAKLDPELVVCDTLRTGQFLETTKRPEGQYVLHMDDLFSVRYRRMIENLRRFPQVKLDTVRDFAKFVPSLFRALIKARPVQERVLRLEQGLVEKREQGCVKWFDTVLLVNEKEASSLRRKTGRASIQTIKPLLRGPRKGMRRDYKGEATFVFLGQLDYAPNLLSITRFISTQMDHIIKKMPGVRLRIIGRGAPTNDLLGLASRYKGVISIEGFVEDLDAVFSTACAMLVPLLSGSGVKLKALEAFSRGIPVVSTDLGVEGIPVTNSVDCIVENDFDRYPEAMVALLDTNHNLRISRKAYELYQRHYSKERVWQEYDHIFKRTSL